MVDPSRRLNCGCGKYPLLYWTNLDADPALRADIHATVPPIPFPAESLDEVYAGHLIEHLTRDEAAEFVREAYRVLVPGGRLGILVPDTREIMRRYMEGAIDQVEVPEYTYWPVADLDAVCHLFLYSTIQASPHKWSYDEHTLRRLMKEGGFHYLEPIDRYRDKRITIGTWYQMGFDGYKPKELANGAVHD